MKRAARYILDGLGAASLLVCLAAGVLWLLRIDTEVELPGWEASFAARRWLGWTREHGLRLQYWFHWRREPFAVGLDTLVWQAPYSKLMLLAAILPAYRIRAWLRRRRQAPSGLCPACGYDLRATPDAGGALLPRCPECGQETGPANA